MVAFWILAPVMVLCALAILFTRKAVHCALLLAVVMISLAVLYAVQDAPFLFAVQIIVYTGAILMLFLFVLMLVGVDASDSLVETIRGQRAVAVVVGLGFLVLVTLGVAQVSVGVDQGLDEANQGGNVPAIAQVLFTRYVLAFEVTSALLITAALGAMVLAHRERLTPKPNQADWAAQRVRDFADKGTHLGPLPPPGTFARHNAVDTPALLPDGSTAPGSVPRTLTARGVVRTAPAHDVEIISHEIGADLVDAVARPAGLPGPDSDHVPGPGGAGATSGGGSAAGTGARAPQGVYDGPVQSGGWSGSVRPLPDGSQPLGHAVKGDLGSRTYYAPGGQGYAATRAEVWFESEESAAAAGFSRPAPTPPAKKEDD